MPEDDKSPQELIEELRKRVDALERKDRTASHAWAQRKLDEAVEVEATLKRLYGKGRRRLMF
jgi:hypothetical protein